MDIGAPLKVHLFKDQKGAVIPNSKRLFSNTLCRSNSNIPDERMTTDRAKVTCQTCRKNYHNLRLKETLSGVRPTQSLGLHMQTEGRALRPPKTRHRRNWRGQMVLQVQDTLTFWRDATPADIRKPTDAV